MPVKRPDPDALLRQIKADEKVQKEKLEGYFKIFLGYAAGVGKTYTMLEEAQALRTSGIDVVIGIVETHQRAETEALMRGIEAVPLGTIVYGGITLEEMDIDGVLTRHPAVVLVDELAHTNAPGSRHEKRYQDVEELLAAGISVYSTLNIQHLESLNDTIAQITGVHVQETIPDRILALADDIELIDLPPETLLQRLREGKVYIPEKAAQAMQKFFQKGHLHGLREISLRYTARKVDSELLEYMKTHQILGPWPAGSRLLVCVSPSPLSERAVRATQQLAAGLDAEWYAVYVESTRNIVTSGERDQLDRNLELAEELGGKVEILAGEKPADEIVTFARNNNVTLILVGAPRRPVWDEWIRGALVYDIVRRSGSINVLVIGAEGGGKPLLSRNPFSRAGYDFRRLIGSVLLIGITTFICLILRSDVEFVNIAMIFLIPVLIAGILWGRLAGVITSLLAVLALDLFFVRPYFSFAIEDLRFVPSFLIFILVAVVISVLAEIIRNQSLIARERERFISSLYSFSKLLLASPEPGEGPRADDLIRQAAEKISSAFECEVLILQPDTTGTLVIRARVGEKTPFDADEAMVAEWVFKYGLSAGRASETFSSAQWFYLPLKTQDAVFGVIGVHSEAVGRTLSLEHRRLLESFVNILALSVEAIIAQDAKVKSM